jgi:hypothetical protein
MNEMIYDEGICALYSINQAATAIFLMLIETNSQTNCGSDQQAASLPLDSLFLIEG